MQITPQQRFALSYGSDCPITLRKDFTLESIAPISTAMSKPAVVLTWSTMFHPIKLPGACRFYDDLCGALVLGPLAASAVWDYVVMNFSTYIIEFDVHSISDPVPARVSTNKIWEYSLNYTTERSNSLELSMTGVNSSSTDSSSTIRALWRQIQLRGRSSFSSTGFSRFQWSM